MNGLNSFDKTDREYSLAPTDDLHSIVINVSSGVSTGARIHMGDVSPGFQIGGQSCKSPPAFWHTVMQ